MSQAAQKVVHEFDALSESDRREVLAELLRRAATELHAFPDDDEMTAAADQVFLELDEREKKR